MKIDSIKRTFINTLTQFYNLSSEERAHMGHLGSLHVKENYNFSTFINQWENILAEVYEACGSWENA